MVKILLYLPFFCLLALAFPAEAKEQQPKVMVINSYHIDYRWVEEHNRALRDELEGQATLVFHYIDAKRLPESKHKGAAARAWDAFTRVKPEIVVLTDDFALKTLGARISDAGVPVIYLGINNNPRAYLGDKLTATGVLERPLLKRSIVYIKDIMSRDVKRCLVLFDDGITAHATLDTVFRGKGKLSFGGTETQIVMSGSFDEWKKTVLGAEQQGFEVVILGLYQTLKDESGKHVPDEEVARWTSANSTLPIFAFWDFAVGKGKAIGGLVLAGYPQGQAGARLVQRVLAGEAPETVQPITAEHGRFLFSRSEMKRWNITLPGYIPSGSESIDFVD